MRLLGLFAATALSLAGAEVAARPLPAGGVTAKEVADVMKAKGYGTEITTDKDGDPLIYSSHQGSKFGVYFYGCKNQRCNSIQFSSGFKVDNLASAKVAEWNRTKRFGRAYVGTNGTLFVEMDMDVEQGATTEALANNFDRWNAVVTQFPKYFAN